MHIKLIAANKTDVGQQRDQNEDKPYQRIETLEDGDHGLFIVADGMGGYKAGEEASRLAVENISRVLDSFFKPRPEQITLKLESNAFDDEATVQLPQNQPKETNRQKTTRLAETPDLQLRSQQLNNAIQQANKAILQHGERNPSARGLGCTVTVALIENEVAYIANVGDSRTYLLRNKQLKRITKDHSLVARLVETKQILPDEVYTHPNRNLIYRSLGAGHAKVDVDIFHENVQPGDTLLLCSDGLWEMVHDDDLRNILQEQRDPLNICSELIAQANANGGEDNISAVVVQVGAYPAHAEKA